MSSSWDPWGYLPIELAVDELSRALSDHGPESCKGFPRVTVKERRGQQTAIERNTIRVASFSGITSCYFIIKILVVAK